MVEQSDAPSTPEPMDDPSDTLIVPPPGFRERLLAAQRARTTDVRSSVEIPIPPQLEQKTEPAKPDFRRTTTTIPILPLGLAGPISYNPDSSSTEPPKG